MALKNVHSPRDKQERETSPFLALRFRREHAERENETVHPFTEMPEELRRSRFSFLGAVRKVLNFLLLLVLGLALFVLVLAFGHQMMTQPEVIAQWAINLIASVQGFVNSLAAQF